jgi:hypothetical protein
MWDMRPIAALLAAGLLACFACGRPDDRAASGTAPETAGPTLAPGDVTVLAPLPAPDHLDALLGAGGLLPDAIAAQIGQLAPQFTPDDTRARLRAVCTRFDPCAPKPGGDPHACIGEMRVVLQPLVITDGAVAAQDAAVHVFYDLDAEATSALARRLVALADPAPPPALAVSPRLARGDAPYASALRELVTDLAAHGELSRVTFLRNVDVKGNGWTFGGFDVHAGGVAVPLAIPRVGGSEQAVVVHGSGPFVFSLSPAPSGDDTLGLLLDPTRLGILADANPDGARDRALTGFAAALALENPTRHDASTADCASCHVAEASRLFAHAFAAHAGFSLDPSGAFSPDADRGTAATTAAQTLRACGYVGTKPALAQRTANESAVAARKMGELAR